MNRRTKFLKTLLKGFPAVFPAGAVILGFALNFSGCETDADDDAPSPPLYKGTWYDDSTSYENANGTLTLTNMSNVRVLVFKGALTQEDFVVKIDALGSKKVKLSDKTPYSITAVAYDDFIQNGDKAAIANYFLFYSDEIPYEQRLNASYFVGYGDNEWTINNYSAYWVALKSLSESGESYAIMPPEARGVKLNRANGEYAYKPVYYKEIRTNNIILGVIDTVNEEEADTASFYSDNKSFTTNLNGPDSFDKSDDIYPIIRVINSVDKTVAVTIGNSEKLHKLNSSDSNSVTSGKTVEFTGSGNPFQRITKGTSLSSVKATTATGTVYTYSGTATVDNCFIYVLEVKTSGIKLKETIDLTEVSANGIDEEINDTETLSAPSLVMSYATTTSVTLGWNSVIGATGYKVYRGYTLLTSQTTTTYTDSGLSAETTYTYKVAAYNNEEEAVSAEFPVTTISAQEQTPVTDASMTLTATAATDKFQIDLAWSFNLPVTSYTVKRGSSSTSFDTTLTTSAAGTSTSYSDTGLPAGKTYYYLVEAEVSDSLYYRKVSQAATTPADITLIPSAVYSEFDIKAGNTQWFKVSGKYYKNLLNYNMNTVSSFQVYDYPQSHSGSYRHSSSCSNPDKSSGSYDYYEWYFSSGSTGTKQVGCSSSYDYYISVYASSDGIYKLRLLDL